MLKVLYFIFVVEKALQFFFLLFQCHTCDATLISCYWLCMDCLPMNNVNFCNGCYAENMGTCLYNSNHEIHKVNAAINGKN